MTEKTPNKPVRKTAGAMDVQGQLVNYGTVASPQQMIQLHGCRVDFGPEAYAHAEKMAA